MELQIIMGIMSCYVTGSILLKLINFRRKVKNSVREVINEVKSEIKKETGLGN